MKCFKVNDLVTIDMSKIESDLDKETREWCEKRKKGVFKVKSITYEGENEIYYIEDKEGSVILCPLYYWELKRHITEWDL